MKKLFVILVSFVMFAGCHIIPFSHYRVIHVDMYGAHRGHWHEVSPGHYRPRRKTVIIEQRRRRGRTQSPTRRGRRDRPDRRDDRRRRNFY